jgi:hypothetical protein
VNRLATAGWLILSAILVVGFAGCVRGALSHEWQIAAENRSDAAVDVVVTHGIKIDGRQSQGSANVGNLGKGKPVSLVVGPGKTVVKTVKVTRNGEAQELTPEVEIGSGRNM